MGDGADMGGVTGDTGGGHFGEPARANSPDEDDFKSPLSDHGHEPDIEDTDADGMDRERRIHSMNSMDESDTISLNTGDLERYVGRGRGRGRGGAYDQR